MSSQFNGGCAVTSSPELQCLISFCACVIQYIYSGRVFRHISMPVIILYLKHVIPLSVLYSSCQLKVTVTVASCHYNTVHWPFFSNTQPSSSCYTQKVPPIIYHPPTKLHGVTHHNTECFLYRHTQHSSCIAYKACIRRYLPESLSRDAPLVIRNVSLLSVAVFCLSEASTLRTVLFCQSLSMLDSVDFPSSAFKRTVI